MHTTRAWIVYTLVRLISFALPLILILLALPGWQWSWLLGIAAGAVVSALVSFIFLDKQRTAMAESLAARRDRREKKGPTPAEEDESFEDAVVDEQERCSLEVADDEQDDRDSGERVGSTVADGESDDETEPSPAEPSTETSSMERPPVDDDFIARADAAAKSK